jgi:hypothetical protein
MNISFRTICLVALCCFSALSSKADLLGVNPGMPKVNYVSQNPAAVSYDPTAEQFTVDADPTGIQFSFDEAGIIIGGVRNVHLRAQVDNTGALIPGTNDFVFTGDFERVVDGVTNDYTGVLLTGDVIAFGSFDSGATDQYDFRVHLNGGALQPFFSCGDLAINLTSENSSFEGSFAESFTGNAKGFFGPEDLIPPTIICPTNSQITVQAATNDGVSGFIITFPDPTVSDNCDPNPTVFADTPSGSFVAAQPGDTITITDYAIDAAGNVSTCSFDVILQPANGPIAFPDENCAPVTLCNDAGKCYATYTFSRPVATNSSGGQFPAMVTAIDQNGMVITLTNLPGDVLQGKFPRTTSGSNIVTFVSDDGQGEIAERQCLVYVKDCEAPVINCMNQTGTFKPVFTNALSCIDGDFGCNAISSNNVIWFSSVIDTPSDNLAPFTVHVFDQSIALTVDGTNNLTIDVPEAYVTFSNGVATATTSFINGNWVTMTKPNLSGNTFLSGVAFDVPFDLRGCRTANCRFSRCCGDFRSRANIHASWCGRFAVDKPGVVVKWGWAAAVYSKFDTNYSNLGIKPIDASSGSAYHNSDNAGTPESFKQFVVAGARGDGRWCSHDDGDKFTGDLTDMKRANLGVGTVCMGPVVFNNPLAVDNCDDHVSVHCIPPSGSIFGPGDHVITAIAMDSSGNSNSCTFTLTVLSPLQVVFDSPCSDNIADNFMQPDAGFTDMNCPDDPSTVQLVNRFYVGEKICHAVRLLDCDGQDVTAAMAPFVTVHIDVTERQGTYGNSFLVSDVPQVYSGTGSPGNIMVPVSGQFQYNLNTSGYESGTANNSRFFRSCVWVDYNSAPGIPVGMEDVILESH